MLQRVGIYFNPGNENYKETISALVYVDKTMLIREINNLLNGQHKYVCVSRARRFGKTITQNMLAAYYSKGCDSAALFADKKISSVGGYEKNMNRFNVIKIDMNSEYQNTKNKEGLIDVISEKIKDEINAEYPAVNINEGMTLAEAILNVYAATGDTFIIIIDEYDVLVREQVSENLFDSYLSFLNGLFKSDTLRPAISLAYITGILPVVREKIQSKLNNFDEYTMLDGGNMAEYIGFTSKEVEGLCRQNDMDYSELRRWYDGYFQHGYEIYNPQSVVKAITNRKCKGYWSQTSTYQVITDRLEANFDGTKDAVIRMLAGESVPVKVTSYMNTMKDFHTRNDVFTYLIHLGYLAYNEEEGTCHIPNREIRDEWETAVSTLGDYTKTDEIIEASRDLLKDTIAGDEKAVARALDESHIHVTSNRSYNNEDALQSAIYLSYIYALNKYTVVREMTAGKGFADVVYIPLKPEDPAMIIELKRNDCAQSAIDQIKEKKYFESLSHYSGNLLFIGIDYDEKAKTHTCKIERFEKG